MTWTELADTLVELVRGVEAPPGSGLMVHQALFDLPLEVHTGERDGSLVFYGRVPHTRWRAGFQPPVHVSHFEVVAVPAGADPSTAGDGGGG